MNLAEPGLLSETNGLEVVQSPPEYIVGPFRAKGFTAIRQQAYEIPNSTASIVISGSAWPEQLAGITNGMSGYPSHQMIPTEIFDTGSFLAGYAPFVMQGPLVPEASRPELAVFTLRSPKAIIGVPMHRHCVDPDLLMLSVSLEQTAVEPLDARTLAAAAFTQNKRLETQLQKIRKLDSNWDGEGATKISQKTSEKAEKIISMIFEANLRLLVVPKCRLSPLQDGSVRFECVHRNKELFVTALNDTIEIQFWQPLQSVESIDYFETDIAGARERVEWLLK